MQEEIDSCTQAKATTVQAKLSKKKILKIGKTVKLSCCKRALASTRISVICIVLERAMFSFPKVFSSAKSLSKAMFSSLTRDLGVLKIKLREV